MCDFFPLCNAANRQNVEWRMYNVQCTTRINFREAMQSTRKILAGAAGLTTAFVAGGFAKDKFNQVNI